MRVGFATGYHEAYWGDWFTARHLGGSERIVVEVAKALAVDGHEVFVRLPYPSAAVLRDGVAWVGRDYPVLDLDLAFHFDNHEERDHAALAALVVCRSDPPPRRDFDVRIYLSRHHARFCEDPDGLSVGGGVDLRDYSQALPRIPRRVLCSASPDRVPLAGAIGQAFDFVHTYKPVPGYATTEVGREELVAHQKQARVAIFPYDPVRESDFFSMFCLESLAAGTPLVMSDGVSHVEWWGESATVLPRPIDVAGWYEAVQALMTDRGRWRHYSRLGRMRAADFDWPLVARRYMSCLLR